VGARRHSRKRGRKFRGDLTEYEQDFVRRKDKAFPAGSVVKYWGNSSRKNREKKVERIKGGRNQGRSHHRSSSASLPRGIDKQAGEREKNAFGG